MIKLAGDQVIVIDGKEGIALVEISGLEVGVFIKVFFMRQGDSRFQDMQQFSFPKMYYFCSIFKDSGYFIKDAMEYISLLNKVVAMANGEDK